MTENNTLFFRNGAEFAPSSGLRPIQTKSSLTMNNDFSSVTRVDQFLDVGIGERWERRFSTERCTRSERTYLRR